MSRAFRCADIAPLGDIYYGRKKIQPAGRTFREFYDAAQGVLKHPLLTFTNEETQAIANVFGSVFRQHT